MNAIMYNTIFGEVMRCTLAGVDAKGHAQWVIVSPGLKPITLDDYLADHDLTGETFRVLCLEDEQADSLTVAKLLGERMQNPLYDLHTELSNCLRELDRLGVSVDTEPLSLNFTVRRVEEKSMRSGLYYFRIEAERLDAGYIGEFDSFGNLDEMFRWIETYWGFLEYDLGIRVYKTLSVNSDLRQELSERHLDIFDETSVVKN